MNNLKTDGGSQDALSSSTAELESEFAARLREAIGDRPILQVARKAKISDSLIRKYLKGSLPGLGNLIALAHATGHRVAWLATGEEPRYPGQAVSEPESGYQAAQLDEKLLEAVVQVVRQCEQEKALQLSPHALGRVVSILYAHCVRNGVPVDMTTAASMVDLAMELK